MKKTNRATEDLANFKVLVTSFLPHLHVLDGQVLRGAPAVAAREAGSAAVARALARDVAETHPVNLDAASSLIAEVHLSPHRFAGKAGTLPLVVYTRP